MPARAFVATAFLLAPLALSAQQREGASFYLIFGKDTIVQERLVRTPARIEGELLDRIRGAHIEFTGTLTNDALISRLELTQHAAAGDTSAQKQTITFRGDSAFADVKGKVTGYAVPAGALAYLNASPVFLEQMLLRLRTLGTPSTTIPLFLPNVPTIAATVTWLGSDSATITLAGVTIRIAHSPSGELLSGTIPAQGVRFGRGPDRGALRAERPDYSPPPGAPYSAEDVVFTTPAGMKVAGTLTLPRDHPNKLPAVITLTGSGQQDRDETLVGITGYKPFRQIADTLGRRGIAVLRIDDRGIGGTGGNPATETSADYADDIRAAVAYLRSRSDIDPARIALLGHSEGGMVAPMVAATDTTIRAIVLLAGPAFTGRKILEYQYGRQIDLAQVSSAKRDSLRRSLPAQIDSMRSVPWMRFFQDYDPLPTARRVHSAVLILQGEGDIQITPDQAPALAAAFRSAGNQRVTVRVFPRLNHLFVLDEKGNTNYADLPSKKVSPEVLGVIADWLATNLR